MREHANGSFFKIKSDFAHAQFDRFLGLNDLGVKSVTGQCYLECFNSYGNNIINLPKYPQSDRFLTLFWKQLHHFLSFFILPFPQLQLCQCKPTGCPRPAQPGEAVQCGNVQKLCAADRWRNMNDAHEKKKSYINMNLLTHFSFLPPQHSLLHQIYCHVKCHSCNTKHPVKCKRNNIYFQKKKNTKRRAKQERTQSLGTSARERERVENSHL